MNSCQNKLCTLSKKQMLIKNCILIAFLAHKASCTWEIKEGASAAVSPPAKGFTSFF